MPCSEDDDSQTGFSGDNTQGLSKAELRKVTKLYILISPLLYFLLDQVEAVSYANHTWVRLPTKVNNDQFKIQLS